ncbi:BioY protein [Sulfobacillus acidophilus TPY]|uniref:Biotin transporter n=1 Tax=Sulfobacillus acidophilus (strain ATCC 700253 / DSM 10332 / NAL) TaxID=679936 RepID=G8TSP3_SULAD|nr:BioY protein [Sulfobacillus acidophilus TPY]AEW04420.1 BioY protein [Sulfobacillus acidophilus DSM 10332]MCY0864854.1 biotin transporter BioY [Sulfobacillus sp.]
MLQTERMPITAALWPLKKNIAGQVALVVAGSLLVALLAQVSIPLPFTPVPVTGQTLGVLLVGGALGSRLGAASLALYLGEGAIGLPVFAGGVGGLPVGPTGGYLVGFVLMAYVVGYLAERGWDRSWGRSFLAMVLGEIVLYAVALPWLGLFVGMHRVLALGFLPFISGDALKMMIAGGLFPAAWKLVGSRPSQPDA